MKNLKSIVLTFTLIIIVTLSSSFLACIAEDKSVYTESKKIDNQKMNLFVSHGHCVTPFTGKVQNFDLQPPFETNEGNPLESMKISFELDPKSFTSCSSDEISKELKTHDLFMRNDSDNIKFRTKDTYTVGLDWYQINGFITIKGIEKEVSFFATGVRNANEKWPTSLILEGQLNLFDWEIDYDKFMTGSSNPEPTKIMRFNMIIEMTKWIPIYPKNK